jgi:hypothetical protein
MRWELWNRGSGDLLETFNTEIAALRAAWRLEQRGSVEWAGDLVLRGEDAGHRWDIATGQELPDRAYRAK